MYANQKFYFTKPKPTKQSQIFSQKPKRTKQSQIFSKNLNRNRPKHATPNLQIVKSAGRFQLRFRKCTATKSKTNCPTKNEKLASKLIHFV